MDLSYEKVLYRAQHTSPDSELMRERVIELDFHVDEEPHQETREFRQQYIKALQKWIDQPENYLDCGGAGKVFSLGDGVCIKVMENRHNRADAHKYNLGNSVYQESLLLRKMSHFSCEGVRSPVFLQYFSGQKYTAIIMEQLNAYNLEHILQGKHSLPERYDRDVFCDRLGAYLEELHATMEVAHMDFEARNVMVDKDTGDPYVIDFGRSVHLKDIEDDKKRYQCERDDEDKYEEICDRLGKL
jgi:serine/threonine protein kinase